jgi:hypothetical protein
MGRDKLTPLRKVQRGTPLSFDDLLGHITKMDHLLADSSCKTSARMKELELPELQALT